MDDESLGGFLPMKGNCPRSTIWPEIGPLSSASQYIAADAISSGNIIRPEGAYTGGRYLYQSA
jgi:hypothetical protein